MTTLTRALGAIPALLEGAVTACIIWVAYGIDGLKDRARARRRRGGGRGV